MYIIELAEQKKPLKLVPVLTCKPTAVLLVTYWMEVQITPEDVKNTIKKFISLVTIRT